MRVRGRFVHKLRPDCEIANIFIRGRRALPPEGRALHSTLPSVAEGTLLSTGPQAPGGQVGKVSKRGQRVPTGCDPLAAETSAGPPLGASQDGPDARPPSRRGCL